MDRLRLSQFRDSPPPHIVDSSLNRSGSMLFKSEQ